MGWWIRFGCFLTGYNYRLLQTCTEASAKTVKKMTSALMIISILWAVIGFLFAQRYLNLDLLGASMVSFFLVVIVIQIERQIILAVHKSKWAAVIRASIGVIMAILGSAIIDQIIFKEDIDIRKAEISGELVNKRLVTRTTELREAILELDTAIERKEIEREEYITEITLKPTIITMLPPEIRQRRNDSTGQMETVERNYRRQAIENPKIALLASLDTQIADLIAQRTDRQESLINARSIVRDEVMSERGFLDELKLLHYVVSESWIGLMLYSLLFAFFLSIELFVLVAKFLEKENDYDFIVKHQLNTRVEMLGQLKMDKDNIKA